MRAEQLFRRPFGSTPFAPVHLELFGALDSHVITFVEPQKPDDMLDAVGRNPQPELFQESTARQAVRRRPDRDPAWHLADGRLP